MSPSDGTFRDAKTADAGGDEGTSHDLHAGEMLRAVSSAPFAGMPDDLARLALQRMMTCDLRWRAYDRASRIWQRTATILAGLAGVASAVAAVSVVGDHRGIAATLSVLVAGLVALNNVLGASGRSATNRLAAMAYEGLANEFERYVQLDLGPPMWSGAEWDPARMRAQLDEMDRRITAASESAPRVRFREEEIHAAELRGSHVIDYLQMDSVTAPPRPVWAN